MMVDLERAVIGLVQGFLPPGGQLLAHETTGRPLVVAADMNGDGLWEVAGVYSVYGETRLLLLKHDGSTWVAAADIKEWPIGPLALGHGISAYHRISEDIRSLAAEGLNTGYRQIGYEGTTGARARITLYPVSVKTVRGTKWGYIDDKGRIAIAPVFDYAFDYQDNGLAIVQVGDKNGVIDRAGRYRINPIYNSINAFSEGRATVIDKQGFKVIDERGRVVTKKAYSFISTYSEGRAMASAPDGESGKYGYLDLQGREAIPFQYEEAGDFRNGKALVKVKAGEYALIGPKGNTLHTYHHPYVGSMGDGLLPFQKDVNGKYGYIDEKGAVVIKPQYTGAQPFRERRAVVNLAPDYGNQYGLIDTNGKVILKPEYNDLLQLGDHRVAVGYSLDPKQPYLGSKYAIADDNGNFLTEKKFYEVSEFTRGYASVSDGSRTFFIDQSGNQANRLPNVAGSGTLHFVGNLIKADVDQRISYFNENGGVVWQPSTVIPLRPPYQVREEKYKPNKDYLVYYPQVEGMSDPLTAAKVNAKLKELSQVKPVGEGQLDYSYTGDFSVEFFNKNLLVLELNGYNYPFGAAHGMPSKIYAHVDVNSGAFYALKDLFKPGSDYVKTLSALIGEQIKDDPQYDYVFPDSYKGINANQPFYVNDEALFIYFPPYEIAPYAAGFPTFKIPYADIMDIIAKDGAFWRSFHH